MTHIHPSTSGLVKIKRLLLGSLTALVLTAGNSFAQPCVTAPLFTTPATDVTINAGPNLCSPLATYVKAVSNPTGAIFSYLLTGATTGSGNTIGNGLAFNKGFTHVVLTATNGCGTTVHAFNVHVVDVTPPTLNHVDITVPAEAGLCGAHVPYAAPSYQDNCPDCNLTTLAGLVALGFQPMGPDNGYFAGTGHYYLLTPPLAPNNFEAIENVIGAAGGHLVSIGSQAEQDFIQANTTSDQYWIGLTDRDQEGVFKWVDGSPFGTGFYSNFCNFQPDDQGGSTGRHQNYCLIHSQGTDNFLGGCWDDGHSPLNLSNNPNNFRGIMEIDVCGTKLVKTAGLNSNDFFPLGVSQVTYQGTDASGNVSTITFNITVTGSCAKAPCDITVTPSNNTYTGGIPTNIYLGYGPQTATLTASTAGGGPKSYLWTGPTSLLSCTTCQSPVFTPTAPGNYTFFSRVISGQDTSYCNVTFCVRDVLTSALNVSCGNPNQVRIVVCHRPPGNPTNVQIQCHTMNSVVAHLAHGDGLGLCDDLCGTTQRVVHSNYSVIGDVVKIYPNPATKTFYLELPYFEKSATVTLTDIQGRILQKLSVNEGDDHKLIFEMSNNPSGMYLVDVIYDDHRSRSKVMIQ